MKYLRDATYVVGGYVVRGGRVLLLWHGGLSRWVPTGGQVSLDYRAARAYHWFSKDDLERFPLMPHVLAYAARALDELSPGPPVPVRDDVHAAPLARH